MNRLLILFSLLIVLSLACSAALPATSASQDQTALSGSVLFQDDFARPVSGWDRFITAEGTMDYDAAGYRMLVNSLNTNFWSTPHKNFADVRMEVDAGKLGGPDENRIGLLCRFTGDDYYFFLIILSFACSTTMPATTVPQDQSALSGSVLFQDDFTHPVSGWDRFIAAEGTIDYNAAGYRMLVNSLNTNFWSTPHKNFADVRM